MACRAGGGGSGGGSGGRVTGAQCLLQHRRVCTRGRGAHQQLQRERAARDLLRVVEDGGDGHRRHAGEARQESTWGRAVGAGEAVKGRAWALSVAAVWRAPCRVGRRQRWWGGGGAAGSGGSGGVATPSCSCCCSLPRHAGAAAADGAEARCNTARLRPASSTRGWSRPRRRRRRARAWAPARRQRQSAWATSCATARSPVGGRGRRLERRRCPQPARGRQRRQNTLRCGPPSSAPLPPRQPAAPGTAAAGPAGRRRPGPRACVVKRGVGESGELGRHGTRAAASGRRQGGGATAGQRQGGPAPPLPPHTRTSDIMAAAAGGGRPWAGRGGHADRRGRVCRPPGVPACS